MFKFIRQYYEMQRGIGDIFLFIYEASYGRQHTSLKNSDTMVGQILKILNDNFDVFADKLELNKKK